MDRKKLLGREGEAEAARYLERKGYKILGLNYSCRYGEIDVIAEKDGCAAIVEVKLRESADFAEAREFVTRSKQAKLRRAALHLLRQGEAVQCMQHTHMVYYTFDFVGLQPSNPMQTKFRRDFWQLGQRHLSPIFTNIQDIQGFQLIDHIRAHGFGNRYQTGRRRILKAVFVQFFQNLRHVPTKHLRLQMLHKSS